MDRLVAAVLARRGAGVARLFGLRVEQLALPMRPLDVAHGMDSQITLIRDRRRHPGGGGVDSHAARQRPARVQRLPTRRAPCPVRTARACTSPSRSSRATSRSSCAPPSTDDGGLVLESPSGRFGQDGAYVVVRDGGRDHAARVPLHETFRVYVDRHGVLRTDHELRLWKAWAVRLHYKLERAS